MAVDPARVRTLFLAAEVLGSPIERVTFLDRECGDDVELRARVEALFAASTGSGTEAGATEVHRHEWAATGPEANSGASDETLAPKRLDEPQGTERTTAIHEAQSALNTGGADVGAIIAGRYTLLSILGEGGMGTVYLAEQFRPVQRQVAIKLIRVGMDSRGVLARFEAERQALALMDHPNIARVYDGGATEAGQPFFVMELVRGQPITHYCDRSRLPVRARLELFATVCQAVQHAHQKGIIHRDIKPGNVLVVEVDDRAVPKVIDFGVAKATGFSHTDRTLADTGAIVGTPTYMSPEQADPSSMDIDTRTDVYALGVILYELLTGSPPIDPSQFKRGALLEMLRMVREVDPSKPSTKVSTSDALPSIAATRGIDPEQLKRVLRGDLDWIVMKALEKDRARRYESANAFAADVLRHLAHEPVEAAPPSGAYRLRKFVRKNRVAVLATALIALTLLGGIAGTTWGLLEARDQAKLAREETARKESARAAEALRVQERDAALENAQHQLANSRFLQAVAAYRDSDVEQALALLDSIDAKYRGWEWRYLRRESIGGIFTLHGHTEAIRGVAYSPDGTQIVSCGDDRTARVWDSRTGVLNRVLRDDAGAFLSVAFSSDGKQIFTGHSDGAVRLWDARTGADVRRFQASQDRIAGIAFSPDGTRIATGVQRSNMATPRDARVWNARTGELELELVGLPPGSRVLSFSPDGRRIVTSVEGGRLSLWDARTGGEVRDEPVPALPRDNAVSPDGEWLARPFRDRVELIPLRPTAEAIADRELHTRPDLDRYRKAHDAARKANDEFAARFYLNRLPREERTTWETWDAAKGDLAAGRPREALARLIKVSEARPSDVELFTLVAALQAWFGQAEDLARTRARVPAFARDTNSLPLAYYTAKVCGMFPSTGNAELEQALTLARTGMTIRDMEWTQLSLGMVEYRRGDFESAEKTLIKAAEIDPKGTQAPILADFYRAMVLERRGKSDDARKLAAATAARMRPIPKDEKDLMAGGADYDDLILWMAYKEAKALLKLEQAPAASVESMPPDLAK